LSEWHYGDGNFADLENIREKEFSEATEALTRVPHLLLVFLLSRMPKPVQKAPKSWFTHFLVNALINNYLTK